ncbi:MAG: hypothetical protein R3A48_12785 [Polyangiales bacterium]
MTRARAALAVAVLSLAPRADADPAAARAAMLRGDFEAAERALARPRAAERATASLLRARIAMETGRYDDAARLAAAVPRGPLRAQAATLEGEALAAQGRYDDALVRWGAAGERAWRARGLAAVWLRRLGRDEDAREAANPLLDAYNDAVDARPGARVSLLRDAEFLTSLSLAARALGATRDANRALNEALRASPDDVEAQLAQADLMRSTEDYEPAGEAVTAALRVSPRSARALVLRARLRLLSGHELGRARDDLDAAARVNPRVPLAFALRAMIALRDGDAAEAERALASGEAVNPRDLDLLSVRAALRFQRGDLPGCRAALDALHAVAPAYADGYQFLAEVADFEHRYAEVAEILAEAAARPRLAADREGAARTRASLGMNLLRMGRESEALEALRGSFETSRHNVRVANVLNLYERVLADEYVTEDAGPLRVRMHRAEAPVLRRHVPALLRGAYADMVRRYGFTPQGPLSVELYASTEHFSVRTSGVPEVGVQGVCFGRVVTALSPRAGAFNWAQIVWHELAHVFALQRSRSRVPRWFTEGLSEWETARHDPRWAREDDPMLWRALREQRVPRVAGFNRAFTQARSGGDMMLAYYAASRLVTFMIERFGFDRVVSALPLWGEGLETPEVIRRALGVSAERLDELFLASLRARLARYEGTFDVDPSAYRDRDALEARARAAPDDADARAAAAMAALVAGDAAAAAVHAERSIRLIGAQPLARWVRAALAMRAGDAAAALAEVSAMREGGADGYAVRLVEATAARAARDARREEEALTAATRLDPTQVEPMRRLAALQARRGRADEEAALLRRVVGLDQHDRESLATLLARDVAASRWSEVLALAEHAMHLDPERASTHLAIAQAAQETGDVARAVSALEEAALLAPGLAAAVQRRVSELRQGRRGMPPLEAPEARE